MKKKAKFDKQKCMQCKYHGRGMSGYSARRGDTTVAIFCDYATITGDTCIRRTPKGYTEDIRGEDFDNCRLFYPGKVKRELSKFRV